MLKSVFTFTRNSTRELHSSTELQQWLNLLWYECGLLRHGVTSPDTLEKRKRYSMTGSKQTAIEEGGNKGVSVCSVL